jgi:hypothetical protein
MGVDFLRIGGDEKSDEEEKGNRMGSMHHTCDSRFKGI